MWCRSTTGHATGSGRKGGDGGEPLAGPESAGPKLTRQRPWRPPGRYQAPQPAASVSRGETGGGEGRGEGGDGGGSGGGGSGGDGGGGDDGGGDGGGGDGGDGGGGGGDGGGTQPWISPGFVPHRTVSWGLGCWHKWKAPGAEVSAA